MMLLLSTPATTLATPALTHLTVALLGPARRAVAAVQALPAVCPTAPPGMQAYQDQVIGWVKWGVIAAIIISALVSVGAIVVGKIFALPHASSRGAIGVAVSIIAAILFVVIIGVINGIVGSGC